VPWYSQWHTCTFWQTTQYDDLRPSIFIFDFATSLSRSGIRLSTSEQSRWCPPARLPIITTPTGSRKQGKTKKNSPFTHSLTHQPPAFSLLWTPASSPPRPHSTFEGTRRRTRAVGTSSYLYNHILRDAPPEIPAWIIPIESHPLPCELSSPSPDIGQRRRRLVGH
jgi:hypothetical protein